MEIQSAARAIAVVGLALAACSTPRPAPMHVTVPRAELAADPDAITVSWVGHATTLIGIHGHWILTDPVFSDRLGGVFGRHVAAALAPSELPPLDAVLISHAHFDHLDLPSLRQIGNAPLLVPPGVATFLTPELRDRTFALNTWQTWTAGGVKITAVPASHGDGRYLFDRWNQHSHTGWIIEVGNRTVYFAGDTGYIADDARELARRYRIDVGLIPVGPAGRAGWIERWRADVHATPEAAIALFQGSGAQWMVPIHFGTFFAPPDRERPLIEAAVSRAHLEHQVRILSIGETTTFHY